MVEAIRFDVGAITNVERSEEGFLIVKGIATRTGVFPYRNEDGSMRYELRHPDDVFDSVSLKTLAGKPATLEHPPRLLTKKRNDIAEHSVGSTSNRVEVIGSGLIELVFNVHREDAIDDVESGRRRQLSAGYRCDVEEEEGKYNGERYTHRQRNIRYNHVAIVERARAGEMAALRMDGADCGCTDIAVQDCECEWQKQSVNTAGRTSRPTFTPSNEEPRMAQITLDGVTYSDISETVAAVMSQKISRLDSIEKQLSTQTTERGQQQARIDELENQVATLTQERDREAGRAFGLESELADAKYELEELKEAQPDDENRTDHMDAAEVETRIQTAVQERVDALDDARQVISSLNGKGLTVPEIKLDSTMTPAAVQKAVVIALNPGVEITDDEVKGMYKALKGGMTRNDSVATFHADMLENAVGATKASKSKKGSKEQECSDSCNKRMDNHKKPLALSKG